MDSITQAALGAAVGEIVLGKKLGWKAVAWGAFFGTLPDLDILYSPFLDEAARLRWHRGISHSLLVMVLASVLLAKPLSYLHRKKDVTVKEAGWMVFWIWSTHVLIDVFTTYGTQIFEPFSDQRVTLNNLFIIDPLFTLPLLIGLVAILFLSPGSHKRMLTMRSCVGLSCFYVLLSFVMKFQALAQIKARVAEEIPQGKVFAVSATPFNIILWRGLIETPEGYFVTYWSPFDRGAAHYDFFAKQENLIQPYEGSEMLESLKWFSRGAWVARPQEDGNITFIDMRFGEIRNPEDGTMATIFQWHLERDQSGEVAAPQKRPRNLNMKSALSLTWKRIWGERKEWESVKAF